MKDQLKNIPKSGYLKYCTLFLFVLLSVSTFPQNKLRIACVGNSITYGAKIEDREHNSYPAQLASMLGDKYDVQNFGCNGATLLKMGDLPYWKTKQYKAAMAFNPDLVFIKLGTNDTKPQNRIYLDEHYMNDYKDLITSFKELPSNPRIVLLVPVPVFRTDTVGITSTTLTEKVIPMVRKVAYDTKSEIINLYNLMIGSPELFPDKIHPNASGAKIIAGRLNEYIRMKPAKSFDLSAKLPQDKTEFNYYGFQGYEFTCMGRKAKVVVPKKAASVHPWIWRACYWGHQPQLEIALLERGFHVVYSDAVDLMGNEEGLSIWDEFYTMLKSAGLSKKSVMEGMSRGGVYIYRWAAKYPKRVSAVYGDAPLLDFKLYSKDTYSSFPQKWELFKKDFGLKTDEQAMAFKGNPIDLAEKIAKAGFPILHVVGDADDVVPIVDHTLPFEEKIKAAGGDIQVIHKPGIGHHPHSLPNPQPIVDFVLMATAKQSNHELK